MRAPTTYPRSAQVVTTGPRSGPHSKNLRLVCDETIRRIHFLALCTDSQCHSLSICLIVSHPIQSFLSCKLLRSHRCVLLRRDTVHWSGWSPSFENGRQLLPGLEEWLAARVGPPVRRSNFSIRCRGRVRATCHRTRDNTGAPTQTNPSSTTK